MFSANNVLVEFLPDPTVPESGLPSPGRGSHLELKIICNDGSGHAVWKHIEAQRLRHEQARQEAEYLRKLLELSCPYKATRLTPAAYSAD